MKKIKQRGTVTRFDPPVETGLNDAQVRERAQAGYDNAVTDKNEKTTGQIVFKNVFTFFNIILLTIAAVFAVFIGYLYSSGNSAVVDKHFGFSKFLFLIPAIMNVTIGTIQELHSRKIIRSLRIVSSAKSRVKRNGEVTTVDAADLVIDDLVALSAGDQATADLIVRSGEVSVDESMLTGESDYIKKLPGDKILSGSSIIVGEALTQVIEVGSETYASRLSAKVKSAEGHKSELMTTIFKIIRMLSVALAVVEVVVIGTLVYKIMRNGGDPTVFEMPLSISDPVAWARIMITGGSFGVGIIPSGLVLTTSVTLMLSIVSLSRKQTLIQELYSLENLSRVDVICLDKTGTLTDGSMTVKDLKCYAHLEEVVECARDLMASVDNRNATAEAIYQKFGASETPAHKETIPFSSATKSSGMVYPDGRVLLMGAPEYLLPAGDERLQFVAEKAKEGCRVLAMRLDERLLCFFIIEDHIRESAPDTLRFFKENGVTVKIISGDNPLTVSKIASMCGVENADKYISLEGMPLEKVAEIAEEYTIFARVSPEQKEALVRALQAGGHKVAMTGDGVNDILALRKADSSITFAKATEAAKSCADVVLMDNDFSHLKDVVGEGRRVIGNVQRTAVLFMMKSIAIIVIAFALIPFNKGQMWFSIENAYMLEAAVIGTGGFLLSLESKRTPIRGSFIKNIYMKATAAGTLAAIAVLLPVILFVLPQKFGAEPVLMQENVRTMMSMLMVIAGIVVILAMCIPFNRYRVFVLLAVIFVAVTLGFMLPTSYIGGQPTGAGMFSYDSSLGQTIMDSTFVREFMRPWNAQAVKDMMKDRNVYELIKLFLFSTVPLFIILFSLINVKIEKGSLRGEFGSVDAIAKMTMLLCGAVLVIDALLAAIEQIYEQVVGFAVAHNTGVVAILIVAGVLGLLLNAALGVLAYAVWRTGKKKYINLALVFGLVMVVMIVFSVVLDGARSFTGNTPLETANLVFINIVISALYVGGACVLKFIPKKKLQAPGA